MAAKRKRITLAEFRAWLQGVEELQPSGWSPNGEQWKLIRTKIDAIAEEKEKPVTVVEQTYGPGHTGPRPQPFAQPQPRPQGHGFIPPPPPVPGGVPADAVLTGVAPKLGSLPPVEGNGSSFA